MIPQALNLAFEIKGKTILLKQKKKEVMNLYQPQSGTYTNTHKKKCAYDQANTDKHTAGIVSPR